MKSRILQPKHPLQQLASGGRIGVISLATDFNIEQDLRRMYPSDVEPFTTRVRNFNPLTIENLRRMEPNISAAADCILPGTKLDAVIYACTSGTAAIGIDTIRQLIQKSLTGVPVTNPITAAVEAFKRFEAKKISMLTPYTEAVNKEVAEVFSQQGIEVVSITGFDFEDDTAMTYINPRDIVQAAVDSCDPAADLMFISCTALRASLVINQIEQQLAKPVVSSNQALAWHSLQLVNYNQTIQGFGQLMAEHHAQH